MINKQVSALRGIFKKHKIIAFIYLADNILDTYCSKSEIRLFVSLSTFFGYANLNIRQHC